MSNFEFQDDKYQVKISSLKKPPTHRDGSLPTLRRKPSMGFIKQFDSRPPSIAHDESTGLGTSSDEKHFHMRGSRSRVGSISYRENINSKSHHEDMASLMHELTELKASDAKKTKRLDEMAARHSRMILEEQERRDVYINEHAIKMNKLHQQQERVEKLEADLRKKARKLDLANQELETTLRKRTEALQEVEAQKAHWEQTFKEFEAEQAEKTRWRNEEIQKLLDEKKVMKESEDKAVAEVARLTEENKVWREKAEGLEKIRKANEEELEKLKRGLDEVNRNLKSFQEDEVGWRDKNKGLEKELIEKGDELFVLKKSKKELEQQLEEETRKLKKKISAQEKEYVEFKEDLEKEKIITKDLRAEVEALKKKEGSMQNEIIRLEKALANKEEELKAEREGGAAKGSQFEKDLLQRNEEIEKHKNTIKGLRADLEDWATKDKKYQNDITRLKETLVEKDEEIKLQGQTGVDKINLLENEITAYKDDIEKQRVVIRDLKSQIEEGLKRERMSKTEKEKSDKTNTEKEKELKLEVEAGLIREKALQAEINKFEKSVEEKDGKLKEMKELRDHIQELTEALEQQEAALEEKEREVTSSRGVARGVTEQNARLEAHIAELQKKVASITGKRSVMNPPADSYSKEKMMRLRDLEAQVKEFDARFEKSEMRARELKNLLKEKEAIITEKDYYIKSLEEKNIVTHIVKKREEVTPPRQVPVQKRREIFNKSKLLLKSKMTRQDDDEYY